MSDVVNIGFLGLGQMGGAIAQRLLADGLRVVIHSRSAHDAEAHTRASCWSRRMPLVMTTCVLTAGCCCPAPGSIGGRWRRSARSGSWGLVARDVETASDFVNAGVCGAAGAGVDLSVVEDLLAHRPFARVDLVRTVTSSAVRRRPR